MICHYECNSKQKKTNQHQYQSMVAMSVSKQILIETVETESKNLIQHKNHIIYHGGNIGKLLVNIINAFIAIIICPQDILI